MAEQHFDGWLVLQDFQAKVIALLDELQEDIAMSPDRRITLEGGELDTVDFQDACFSLGEELTQFAESLLDIDPDIAKSARLLRLALGNLLNWALVVKEHPRDAAELHAYQERFGKAWADYRQNRDVRDGAA